MREFRNLRATLRIRHKHFHVDVSVSQAMACIRRIFKNNFQRAPLTMRSHMFAHLHANPFQIYSTSLILDYGRQHEMPPVEEIHEEEKRKWWQRPRRRRRRTRIGKSKFKSAMQKKSESKVFCNERARAPDQTEACLHCMRLICIIAFVASKCTRSEMPCAPRIAARSGREWKIDKIERTSFNQRGNAVTFYRIPSHAFASTHTLLYPSTDNRLTWKWSGNSISSLQMNRIWNLQFFCNLHREMDRPLRVSIRSART